MNPLRKNTGIAIDGGGIKGLIIARALMSLETELGCKPLINHPQIKILAGTSTGASSREHWLWAWRRKPSPVSIKRSVSRCFPV